ncbi:major facilitator transporter [Streptosporangium roseum DSM 43021]|uniref:Major facilitator transporter n=1 Tax=Streptosporangium roseum (strain ATCC 12428 / DSM 43021 / JCM 3005 / KCTC 9067 / NCIMB 10171 / NRRL 2505 / NI 9100) TaxID=479432 RepID=D2AYR6_STRRD|nr:major facilitator transporter [Streptosporangium roseum DSM 43021]
MIGPVPETDIRVRFPPVTRRCRSAYSVGTPIPSPEGRPVSAPTTSPPGACAPSVRRDFGLLWAGQSLSLFGDQFMTLALPLLAVTVLEASPAQAALLPFALFLPFLPLGLPAGAIVDRLSRRMTMLVCDGVQVAAFGAVWALAATGTLTFPLLFCLVLLSGCAMVFFQVAYTSYLPSLYGDPQDLHRGNTRLALSESASKALGPMAAGPLIHVLGLVGALAANAISFTASVVSLALIRHREQPGESAPRVRGWLRRDVATGLRFALGHPILQPVLMCGTTYVLFLSMVETSLVLYCRNVLGLSPQWIGVVIGAAAAGYPIGNLLSSRLIRRFGTPRTLLGAASLSVLGIVSMPALGSLGGAAGTAGLIAGSIVHCVGEGAFSPTSLTLRQTATPAGLLGRVGAVQRFLLWGAVALGSLLAAGATALGGLSAAVWIGALGTVLCIPALLRQGIRAAVLPQTS